MGNNAELILMGTICQTCGSLIDGSSVGHPRTCEDCDKE